MDKYNIKKIINISNYKVIKIEKTEKEIFIELEPYKGLKAKCSGCGKMHEKGYHSFHKISVEDLRVFELRTYLTVKRRRYRCSKNNKIYVEEIPWIKKWSRVTSRFAETINRLTAITTNQEAGWYLGLNDEVVYRIDKEILEEKAKEKLTPVPAGINLSVDEVSYLKYHRYLTNVIDTDRRLVIWNDKGRKAEVLDRYYEGIGKINCEKIESVALDGARTYISSTNKYAVNALIVYDKFHIMQKLNHAVDSVRLEELHKAHKTENKELIELTNCRQRFILLKSHKNLTDKQSEYLEKLCKINEPIYKAMLLKESFLQIYAQETIDKSEDTLKNWIKTAENSTLKIFQELAKSFTDKMTYILNWFKRKISSAISEGFNNKIKRLKRMAYGYKDIEYFKLKIHQHCGLLNPRLSPIAR
jgi:transposase